MFRWERSVIARARISRERHSVITIWHNKFYQCLSFRELKMLLKGAGLNLRSNALCNNANISQDE